MTEKQRLNLQPGTVIRHRGSGTAYVVVYNGGPNCIFATRSSTVNNASEWMMVATPKIAKTFESEATDDAKRFIHIQTVVQNTFPYRPDRWFEMADRIQSGPSVDRCDYCQCCGNDSCNSRKCKRCIRAKTEKIP